MLPYTPNDNTAEPQIRALKAAMSNAGLDSAGAIGDGLKWCFKSGLIDPVKFYDYATVDSPRISPRKAAGIKKRPGRASTLRTYRGRCRTRRSSCRPSTSFGRRVTRYSLLKSAQCFLPYWPTRAFRPTFLRSFPRYCLQNKSWHAASTMHAVRGFAAAGILICGWNDFARFFPTRNCLQLIHNCQLR